MYQLTCVDAFCGAGGLSLGLSAARFRILMGFDIDPICIKTSQHNQEYIDHPVLQADIRSMLHGQLLRSLDLATGELDLLAGGPPCQGFSVQRTAGDDNDKRNLLVNDYCDLILEVRPRFFLMENVVGLRGKRGRVLLREFKQEMHNVGYTIHQRTLDASDFGVPQRRRRVIVVGERRDTSEAKFQWPSPSQSPPTVRDTIGHLPPPPHDGSDHPDYPGHRADQLSQKNKERLRVLKPGQDRTNLPEWLLADCHRASPEAIGHRNVYGRMAWDDVAPTITARFDSFTRGKFGHPEQIRSISLYEGALLQTFPSDFRFLGTKVEMARQIGNAVPPRFAQALGSAIAVALIGQSREALHAV